MEKAHPKNQRLNVLSDMWMLTNKKENGRIEVHWIKQREIREGSRIGNGNRKDSRMNQTELSYI